MKHLRFALLSTATALLPLFGRQGIAAVAVFGLALMGRGLALAALVYNGSVSGDLSNSGLTPTILSVALGSNQVFGTTGKDGATLIVDRDSKPDENKYGPCRKDMERRLQGRAQVA